ncbi:hypothetical protein BN946_scf184881.g9 [Trametes cinnabarina]|uniref:Uncharacterized protein n=1 Tax=Pycnoporus cinnabarinus TaxID=5643 RepID=A0A060SSW3_PYCCI|nr:hypothetical protein BN946_scf184881.g9 [Trametes cinnabarina]
MAMSLWKQRISINSVDLYAWGERVDDLYAQQNSQVAIFVHIDGADARTVLLIEFTRLLLSKVCRHPSHLALTYRGATAGLNLTFAMLEDLDAFQTYAPQHASPRMILARPDGLQLMGKEDITTGYE